MEEAGDGGASKKNKMTQLRWRFSVPPRTLPGHRRQPGKEVRKGRTLEKGKTLKVEVVNPRELL